MDKDINNNGYDYVDLGLPSGTLWATCNVGASKPSECGLYFQWGDTHGYTNDQVGKDKQFASDYNDYKWGKYPNFTKYTTSGATLEFEDDAAKILMGGDWHIPTPEKIIELIDNTTTSWTAQDGVKGRLFTSKSDTSKSIFIPAAGFAYDGTVFSGGRYGHVWSSMVSMNSDDSGRYLFFSSDNVYLNFDYRYYGFSVRGVIG